MSDKPRFQVNLDDLQRLAMAATPGPWVAARFDMSVSWLELVAAKDRFVCKSAPGGIDADLEFIAEANPAAILSLIEMARATQQIEALDVALAVLKELDESAEYWSEYDVPIGIQDRIKAAIANGEAALNSCKKASCNG